MYPITVIGRILACICAYFGVATSGILVSILVNRYQRVYNRKKFCPEQIISAVDSNDVEHDEKQDFINRRISETKKSLSTNQAALTTTAHSIYSAARNMSIRSSNSLKSYARLIILLSDNEKNGKTMEHLTDEILQELSEVMKNDEHQMHFKLVKKKEDSSHSEISASNDFSSNFKL